jgi:hypothetical protein
MSVCLSGFIARHGDALLLGTPGTSPELWNSPDIEDVTTVL